jgi:hypothetical protein
VPHLYASLVSQPPVLEDAMSLTGMNCSDKPSSELFTLTFRRNNNKF